MSQESVSKLAPLAMNLRKVREQAEAAVADAQQANRDHGELDSILSSVAQALDIVRNEIMG
jgi:outer membrane murein-binding lipoprotein Lpp